jgi:hypothetical protein
MSRAVGDVMLRQLKEPFDPKFLKWRVGATNADKTKGIALCYLDAREVMKRLDDVCGIGGWQSWFKEVPNGYVCDIQIKIDGEWINKSNGAGLTQVEPVKGGMSDAFKRTASTWGVGRYLYYLPNVWVSIKPQGRSFALAEIPQLPDWAMPSGQIERWEDVAELELDANDSQGADATESVDDVGADNNRKQAIIDAHRVKQ